MESRQGKGKENTSDVVYILAIKNRANVNGIMEPFILWIYKC